MSGGTVLERLDEHLRGELDLHRNLLRIAEAKRDDIVAGDIQAFSKLLAEEQALMAKGHEMSRLRQRIIEACAKHLDTSADKLRLAQILERAPDALRDQLSGVQNDLKQVLTRLREVNERNMILIRQSLDFLREVMQIITGQEQRKQDYGRNGGDRPNQSGGGSLLNASC